MRCRKVRSFLSTYSKGELTDSLTDKVRTHLESCPSCRREEMVVRSVSSLVEELPRLETSDDFNTRLLQRISRQELADKKTKAYLPGAIPRFGTMRLATVAATAMLLLVTVIGFNYSDTIFGPSSAPFVLTETNASSGLDQRYLTVQPVDNPLLNERKTVERMVEQYNRWRGYSRQLRSNTAEQFLNGSHSILASSSTIQPGSAALHVRPVIKNYLLVPGAGTTGNGSGVY